VGWKNGHRNRNDMVDVGISNKDIIRKKGRHELKRLLFGVLVAVLLVSLVLGACSKSTPMPATTQASTAAQPSTTAQPSATSSTPLQSAPAIPASTTTPSTQAVKAIELSFNTQTPGPAQPGPYKALEFFKTEVSQRTNGRVKINMYYGATLAAANTTFNAVVNGVTDIGESLASYYPGQFPVSECLELPLGYPSAQVYTHMVTDFYNKYKPAEYNKVVVLFFGGTAPLVIGTTKKEVQKMADLKGLTIRTTASGAPILQFLGATPKVAPMPETYDMLSKGVVDGVLSTVEVYPGFKLGELIHYIYDISPISSGLVTYMVMNKDSWNKLSSDDQKIIMQVASETSDLRSKGQDQSNVDAIKVFLAQEGRRMNTPSTVEAATMKSLAQNLVDDWIKKKTAEGLPAAEYVKFAQERLAYWTTQLVAK
jgi:TRAP-type transport system periplasmic protein